MRPRNVRRTRRRLGTTMIAASLALAAWSVGLGAAVAQEEPQAPEEMEQAEIDRSAYYQAPTEQLLPSTVVSEFPPGVVCIVRPELCPEELEPVTSPVEDGLGQAQEGSAEAEPEAAPMPPDTLPVSATGGHPDYRSALQFALPNVPEGQQVDSFKVYLTESDPSYSRSSPAFRQAVLAVLACFRGCDQEQFEKISDAGAVEDDPLDVEVCPISGEWEEGEAQKDDKLPEVDCLYGATGTRIDTGDTVLWEFDLTFTMQGLAEDQLTYNGFLIRPANLPNLAYGDPDTTYNKQIAFARQAGYTVETSEAPEPVATLDLGSGSSGGTTSSGSSGGFSSAPAGGSSSSTDAFSAPGGQTSDEAAAAPQVADPAAGDGAEQAPTAGSQEDTTLAAGGGDPEPASAWWVWSLVPIFLGGMYLTTQSLMAAPVAAGTERAGAMTRLIEKRRQASAASGAPELVQF